MRSNSDLFLESIKKGDQSNISFEIEHGGSFEVIGSAHDVEVATSGKISVTKKPDPLNKTVSLSLMNGIHVLDDSTSFEQMSNSFKRLGSDYGSTPLPLKTALKTVIGSLIVARKATKETPGEVFYTVSPSVLGVKILNLEDIERFPTSEKSETKTSGKTANKVSTHVKLI